MWCFETPVICIFAFCISLSESQVTLELCDTPIKDSSCVLQCLTPDLSQSVVFKKDNTEYASCKFILGFLSCTSIYPTRSLISQQSSPAITSLNITQLSRAGDQGSWTCDYGSSGSSAQTLTVLTATLDISKSEEVNIDYCGGNKSGIYYVTLTSTCSSSFTVEAEFSKETELCSTNVPAYTEVLPVTKGPACSDVAENIYTAVFTITNTTGNLTGDNYTLTFKIQLSGGIGQVYCEPGGNIAFSPCSPDCVFFLTILLGGVLCLIFTPLFMTLALVILAKCCRTDDVRKCSCKTLFKDYWYIILTCILVSCGAGTGFTYFAVSKHDTGYKETGCSCIEYVGVIISMSVSLVMTVPFLLLVRCLENCYTDSTFEISSSKRKDQVRKEEEVPGISKSISEQANGKQKSYEQKDQVGEEEEPVYVVTSFIRNTKQVMNSDGSTLETSPVHVEVFGHQKPTNGEQNPYENVKGKTDESSLLSNVPANRPLPRKPATVPETESVEKMKKQQKEKRVSSANPPQSEGPSAVYENKHAVEKS